MIPRGMHSGSAIRRLIEAYTEVALLTMLLLLLLLALVTHEDAKNPSVADARGWRYGSVKASYIHVDIHLQPVPLSA